jgi:hypothetical protein
MFYEDNVKAVVTKVSLGEVDGGIVHITEVWPGHLLTGCCRRKAGYAGKI